jgi:dienelactone hydrolase
MIDQREESDAGWINKSNIVRHGMAVTLLYCFLLFFPTNTFARTDPFDSYLTHIPTVTKVISESNSSDKDAAIVTRRFLFESRNGMNTIYAIIAFPQKTGIYPALLALHGGGSKAEDLAHMVEDYARRGYVAMCFDMPGICNNSTTPNSSGSWKLRPGPTEALRFDIAKGPENSTLFDAEVAGLDAFNFLSAQPNVDKKHIGITGFSWGGYSTTFLSGILGSRVKAAYSVFGCGFYETGSFWQKMISELPDSVRVPWLTYFDAGRRAPHIKAPYFLEATSNDTYFWPPAVENTLSVIPGVKNHVWDTNLNHKQQPGGPAMQRIYFDYYLKGEGAPFGTAKIGDIKSTGDGGTAVTIKTKMPKQCKVMSVVLYYSASNVKWQDRTWVPITAIALRDNRYTATIPAYVNGPTDFYAYVSDDRSVSVASQLIVSQINR